MTGYRLALLFLAALFLPFVSQAQVGATSSPDPRVRSFLEEKGYNYEVEENGDFRVLVEYEDGRSQNVWVESRTTEVMGLEVRELYSPVYVREEDIPVSDEIAQWALQKSEEMNVGSLASTGNGLVYYSLKIDANASPEILSNGIDGAGAVADELEKGRRIGDDL